MITLSGKVPLTTLPAPTTTLLPKVDPFRIIEFAPIKQPSPMTIRRFLTLSSCSLGCRWLYGRGWKSLSIILHPDPMSVFFPISIPSVAYNVHPLIPTPELMLISPPLATMMHLCARPIILLNGWEKIFIFSPSVAKIIFDPLNKEFTVSYPIRRDGQRVPRCISAS